MDQAAWRREVCGHETLYEIIVRAPAFSPSNNYAPSGRPRGGGGLILRLSAASPAGTGGAGCLLQVEDTRPTVCTKVHGQGGAGGEGNSTQQYCSKVLVFQSVAWLFQHPDQVENSATECILQ